MMKLWNFIQTIKKVHKYFNWRPNVKLDHGLKKQLNPMLNKKSAIN
jgi:hypothetical protein